MNRRTLVAAPLAALAGAAALVPVTFGQDPAPGTLTFEMRHKEARVTMIDESPRMTRKRPSESPGDSVVSRGTLRDAAGAKAGSVHAQFTVTHGRSPNTTEQVVGAMALTGGQITVHGLMDQKGNSETIAITGGTGAYDGARGTVEISGNDKAVKFVVRLR